VPDAVREAVERTVQATLGGAQQARAETRGRAAGARTRAQEALDDVARTTRGRAQEAVEGVVKSAEVVGERVRGAFDDARPATHDDLKELQKELRAINRRLEAIEKRLPAPKSAARAKPAPRKKS
jgi:hypothetical protein